MNGNEHEHNYYEFHMLGLIHSCIIQIQTNLSTKCMNCIVLINPGI